MTSYRTGGPCEFCDDPADAVCARCACATCPRHAGTPYCALCLKEARDEADVARFRSALLSSESGPDLSRGSAAAPLATMVIGWLGRLVYGRRPEPATVPFARRSPEDIRAWRRTAGVRTRD